MGGRSAAALVVIPHEEADDAGKHDDGAQKEGQHYIAAAAAIGGIDFRGHGYLLVRRFMNARTRAWFTSIRRESRPREGRSGARYPLGYTVLRSEGRTR